MLWRPNLWPQCEGGGCDARGNMPSLCFPPIPANDALTWKQYQYLLHSSARIGDLQIYPEQFYPALSAISRPADKCKTGARLY
jgi:hypothetical protein